MSAASGWAQDDLDTKKVVLDGRVVGLGLLDEDAEPDAEEVCLDGELVCALAADDALTELPERAKD